MNSLPKSEYCGVLIGEDTEGGRKWGRDGMGVRVLLVAMILLGGLASPAAAGEFRRALPGYAFAFPRDHFAHEAFRTEWWYYTGHLRTQAGEEYG